MKKFMVLIVIVFALTACSPVATTPSGIAQELPMVQTPMIAEQEISSPSGSYIFVRVLSEGAHGSNHYFASLYFNGNEVCEWDLFNTAPWNRDEDLLYFTPENCDGLDPRNGVIWHVDNAQDGYTYGQIVFESQIIAKIPVWIQVGTQLTNLTK